MSNQITFEQGYQRLIEITRRLDEEPGVEETCNLFREGKSLEQALRRHLEDRQAELQAIERGEGLTEYTIIPPESQSADPAGPPSATASGTGTDAGASDGDSPEAAAGSADVPPPRPDMF